MHPTTACRVAALTALLCATAVLVTLRALDPSADERWPPVWLSQKHVRRSAPMASGRPESLMGLALLSLAAGAPAAHARPGADRSEGVESAACWRRAR